MEDSFWEELIVDKQLRNPISDQQTSGNCPKPANNSILRVFENKTSIQLKQNNAEEVNDTSIEWRSDSHTASVLNPDIELSSADFQIPPSLVTSEPHINQGTALEKVEVCVNKEQSVKSTFHFDSQYMEDVLDVLENHTTTGDNANSKVWSRPTLMQDHNLKDHTKSFTHSAIQDSLQRPSEDALALRVFIPESSEVKKTEQAGTVKTATIVQSAPCLNNDGSRKRTNGDDRAFFDANLYGKAVKTQAAPVPEVQILSTLTSRIEPGKITDVERGEGQREESVPEEGLSPASVKSDSYLAHICQQHPIASPITLSVGPPNPTSATLQRSNSTIQVMSSSYQIAGTFASNAPTFGNSHQNTIAPATFTYSSHPTKSHQSSDRLAGNDDTLQEAFPATVPDSAGMQRGTVTVTTTPVYGGNQRPRALAAAGETSSPPQQPARQSVDHTVYQSVLPPSINPSLGHAVYRNLQLPNAHRSVSQTFCQTRRPLSTSQSLGIGISQPNQLPNAYHQSVGQALYPSGQITPDQIGRQTQTVHQTNQPIHVKQIAGQASSQTNRHPSAYQQLGQTASAAHQAALTHSGVSEPTHLTVLPTHAGLNFGHTVAQTNQTTSAYKRPGSVPTAPVDPIKLGVTYSRREMGARNQCRILPATPVENEIEKRVQSFRRYPSVFSLVPNFRMITQLASCGFFLVLENMFQCVDRRCSMKHLLPNVFDKDSTSVTWHKNECRFHSARRPCKHCVRSTALRAECLRCGQEPEANRAF